jgi:hypothetical protein
MKLRSVGALSIRTNAHCFEELPARVAPQGAIRAEPGAPRPAPPAPDLLLAVAGAAAGVWAAAMKAAAGRPALPQAASPLFPASSPNLAEP